MSAPEQHCRYPVVQKSAFRALVPLSSYGIPTGQGSRTSHAYTRLTRADRCLPICTAGTSAPQADFYCCHGHGSGRDGVCACVVVCAGIFEVMVD